MAVTTRIAPTCGGPSYVHSVNCIWSDRQLHAAHQRARKEFGKVGRPGCSPGIGVNSSSIDHFVEIPSVFQRVCQTEAADHQVRPGSVAAAVQAGAPHPGPSLSAVPSGSSASSGARCCAVQIGRAHFGQTACRVRRAQKRANAGVPAGCPGKKKIRLPLSSRAKLRERAVRRDPARERWPPGNRVSRQHRTPSAAAREPGGGAFGAQRKGGGQARTAPRASSARAVSARKGCASNRLGGRSRRQGRSTERRGGMKRDATRSPSSRTAGASGPRPLRPGHPRSAGISGRQRLPGAA